MGTLLPKPPPMSGEMMRTLDSGRPDSIDTTVRTTCGACEVIQVVSSPRTGSNDATQPQVSSGQGWTRG